MKSTHQNIISIVFILFTLLQIQLPAQNKNIKQTNWPEPVFEHLTIADGLPESFIRCILQDHLGYLWFGTQSGLVRYDGYDMHVYYPNPEDSLSISQRQVWTVFEDKTGTLWIGTQNGGLNRFERSTETFTRFIHNPNDSTSINSNSVRGIYEDKVGNLFVSTYHGLNLFDRQTENFRNIRYQTSVFSDTVYQYISSLIARGKRISSILQVGNRVNLKKTFAINKKTIVLTIIMDEAGYDYGWMENNSGKIVSGLSYSNVLSAGGHTFNQVHMNIDTLERGDYQLRFTSDQSWSYNNWGDTPPDYPDFWGIQVIDISDDHRNVGEIIKNIKRKFLKYRPKDIIEDQLTGKILVGVVNKVLLLDLDKQFLTDKNRVFSTESKMGDINSFHQSTDGTIWIGHSIGLSKFNPIDNSIKMYQPVTSEIYIPENFLTKLLEDKHGFIWGCTGQEGPKSIGLICFDPTNEQFRRYKSDPDKQWSLVGNDVSSLYEDNSGIIWIGTQKAGLNKWDRNKYKFNNYTYKSTSPDGEEFKGVQSIAEDSEGLIWFSADKGLYSFNPLLSEFQNYKIGTNNNSYKVTCIYEDKQGVVWFGTTTRGLGRFDLNGNSYEFYSHNLNDTTTISHDNVSFIVEENDHIIWIGTWGGGLNRFNRKTKEFTRFKSDMRNPKSLASDEVSCIYIDRKRELWIGTNLGGLNHFNKVDESFESFNIEGGTAGTTVASIYEDQRGNFWVGMHNHGIYLFDRNKKVPIDNITQEDGLANNSITAILEDDSNNLWISTSNGLSKFDPETRGIKNYFTSEAFEENRYWSRSACKTSTGEMLFGTYDGFIMFHPDSIKDDPVPPQVVISYVSLFNRPGEKLEYDGFISEIKELNLQYNENDLRFDNVGLHYSDPSKNQYKYMLEGFDEDWIDAGTQRNATYTNLDAGEYIFRITACNADGVWNEEGASLKIIIPPPFWATWWAYSFYILFFLGLLYSIRRYELNRTQLKNQIKLDEVKLKEREETDKMKSRFFANISHEFRTPLTLIKGPAEKINKDLSGEEIEKQTNVIKRNADRLLALINQLLDLSKLEAGKLELKASKNNIVPFIKGITMSFESVAERKDITLKVKSSNNEMELYFDKEKMTKIMTNLLSNAFKFTPEGGVISVSIVECHSELGSESLFNKKMLKQVQHDNCVKIKVSDTGIGISEEELPKLFDRFYQVDSSQTREHEGTGIGLALTKELVELHHGTISAASKLGSGTEFTIELPIGRSHLKDEEIVEGDIILSEAKNLNENNAADSSHFDKLSVTNNAGEDKNIVLVVEDNADVREFIKDSLGNEFQFEEAANGEQGVRKAEQIIPDLIISDVMMPKMDGNELTRILKNDEKTSHIPIILLTAKSEQQSKLEGLETGADDYLTKPFDTRELQIRINNLINIRRKLQEKFSSVNYVPVKNKKENEKKLTNLEEQFMCKVMEVIENHLSEEEFSIEQFGKEVGMSRVQLHRKLKALSGKSASNYLRSVRLNKAKKMIEEQIGNISEIAYSVGFSSPQYFTRCFKEEFGYTPSELSQ